MVFFPLDFERYFEQLITVYRTIILITLKDFKDFGN